MPAPDQNLRLVWLDLEMTGLDDKTCTIIEMAMIITDADFKEMASYETAIWHPESTLQTMSPFVKKMHTDNGLLDKVRASKISLAEAEDGAMAVLAAHVPFKKGVLAGNSIWQDRRFLLAHMQHFEQQLHYRMVDVSTIKVLGRAWYGDKADAPGKASTHTALDDIRASIAELKWYRDHLFTLVPG